MTRQFPPHHMQRCREIPDRYILLINGDMPPHEVMVLTMSRWLVPACFNPGQDTDSSR
ncbi:hypothetical protein [Pseudohongiella sp.]|uniref:hypothetical protein n=1 Tax=Pseudohongiella sp. TaxID=1979412 RepID=UPI0025E177B6|nr:hypothetical protein [Pseudohongiella sp.]